MTREKRNTSTVTLKYPVNNGLQIRKHCSQFYIFSLYGSYWYLRAVENDSTLKPRGGKTLRCSGPTQRAYTVYILQCTRTVYYTSTPSSFPSRAKIEKDSTLKPQKTLAHCHDATSVKVQWAHRERFCMGGVGRGRGCQGY